MKTIELTACPVCGSADADPIELGQGRHRRCRDCGTVYTAAYGDPDAVFVDGYFDDDSQFGIDVSHPRFQAALDAISERRMATVESVIGGKGSLLDVGCGTGEFPAVAARRGWSVQGVELMAEAAERARERGLDVRTGYLEESGLPERSYDVVSAMHVLEHIPESIPFIQMLARYVRPGGHLLIEVPNFGSELRDRTLGGWIHLRPLEHLVHFTPDTLRRALGDAGLEVVSVSTPSWPQREHTLDEALANLGRPTWRRWLAPFCPTREVVGVPSKVPSRPVRWLLSSVERGYRRRLRGMVVFAIARVP